ncbi:CUB domain-containing protein 1 [Hippoglossus stenolepis]|uniref:CUB domain-containing protein 1 n=1 Tax=Hippoglossus stenolepis TaxID=195615 RepID=UPI001FAECCC8|nr:CUB domain-containing protein 1 [Hippoglossus stenolepis]XP_047200217.1 CUB domain-containing protein 1 [Hippoglossus stenolepis]
MRLRETRALLGLLVWTVFGSSECLQTVVRSGNGSSVTVSTELPLDQCAVCTVSGVNDTETSCHPSFTLVPEEEVKLLFNCSQPIEQSYTVTVTRAIECTKDACSPATVETQPILTEFSRIFIWELKAPEKTVVSLNILGDGLKETSQPCTDGFQYLVATSKTDSKSQTQYCRGGSVTRLDLPSEAVVSLTVQPKAQVESVFQASAGPLKGRTMVVSVDPSTTAVVSRDPGEPECEVCTVDGSAPNCSPTEKTLTNVDKLSLEFSCPKPQEMYSVKMEKKIECTQTSCAPAAGDVDPSLFVDFKRSITWDIKVPERTVISLDFTGAGLKAISGAESCKDGYQYSVSTTKGDGSIKDQSFCRGGTVSHLDLLGATTVTVEVPKEGEVEQKVFSVKATPRGSRIMSVTPDPKTIILITRVSDEPDCSVCVDKAPEQKCNPRHLRIVDPRNTSVEFTCPRPQDVFRVEINREIDCTETSCSGDIVQAESSLFPDFNRTFTWDMKVVATRAFQLDFPETGMRQIPNKEACPDGHTYTLITYLRGVTTVGTFCKGGTVTTILARYKGRVSLEVAGDTKLDPVDFKLRVGPETNMTAIMKVNLPRGVSDTDFMAANYPANFPDDQQMQWNFTVPGMHNYTVHFRNHTAPECLSKKVEVEYKKEDKKGKTLTLTDAQPAHQQGNFNMVLKNCQTNQTLQGLTLNYTVSVMRSGHPVLCTVDLTSRRVSLQIEKVGSDPYCEMSIGSKVEKKINVAAGTKASLSFLDCPNEEVRLTASEVIGCENVSSCSSIRLGLPKLVSCLPMPLHSFTWHIDVPQDGTVNLVSPKGGFQQSLPAQRCNGQVLFNVAERDGYSLGDFCFTGIIQKIQANANVSITATAKDFSMFRGPFPNVSFSQEIPETFIYRISPKPNTPTLLATPNWPQGMKPSSTMSWIVTLPSQYQAHLQFVNVSQPKCLDRHTAMTVKMLGYEEEIMSRREDEQAEDKLLVPQSFYLNMSNCIPEEGHFAAVTKIVLQKKTNLLAILLGIAGALLLVLIVLAVVCVVTKKKKQQRMNKESSIYIAKGNVFRPGDRHFTKNRSDNESHVYASIDESMIYGHLLGDTSYADSMQDHFNGMPVDSYQTFTGPSDGQLPVINEPDPEPQMDQYKTFLDPSESFIPSRPRTPITREDSLGFQDRRMVDNELYTFKSTGDMNTIRLSAVDLEPEPSILEDSL